MYDHLLSPAVAPIAVPLRSLALTGLARHAQVLDVGCGGGQLAFDIARFRPDLRILGIDASQEQIERAVRRVPVGGTMRFEVGTADNLPVARESQDLVLSVASLKHWPDRGAGLAECVRALRPGGRLLVAEVDRGCHLDDARRFVRGFRVSFGPEAVRLALFRTWVAGQGLDLDEARQLASELQHVTGARARRIDGAPAILIEAERAA